MDVHPTSAPQLNDIPRNNWGQYVILFINGYIIIVIIEESPISMVKLLNCNNTERPIKDNINIRNNASDKVILLLAKGLFLVLSTFASILLSIMSLKMQPTALIIIEPIKNKNIKYKSGYELYLTEANPRL